MRVMQKITIITAIILTVFDAFLVSFIKRSTVEFKTLFSSQEIKIMALVELRWKEDLGICSSSVFIHVTVLIHWLKFQHPEKFS